MCTWWWWCPSLPRAYLEEVVLPVAGVGVADDAHVVDGQLRHVPAARHQVAVVVGQAGGVVWLLQGHAREGLREDRHHAWVVSVVVGLCGVKWCCFK